MRENLVVTIMAAGEGKRMNSTLPKVLVEFRGYPMLIRILLEVYKLEPERIIIVTGKYHNLIIETMQKYITSPQKKDILYFVQQEIPQGTGDAIKNTLNYFEDNSKVLILNGDMPLISAELLLKFINERHEGGHIPKLMVAELDNPYGYGRILYNDHGEFQQIKEEKDACVEEKEVKIVNVGIYYFQGSTLKTFIPKIQNKNAQKEYYLTDIVSLIRPNPIYTYLVESDMTYQIHGINTQAELRKLENFVK